jgi:UDP-glucose 4-epimerase
MPGIDAQPANPASERDPMRVLVTGGCGYVGSHVSLGLARAGHRVTVVDDLSLGSPENIRDGLPEPLPVIQVDVRDSDALTTAMRRAEPEVVIHLAALHFIPACNRDPQRAIRVNVDGTQGVLRAAADAPSVAGVVVASTAAVYAPSDEAHSERSAIGPTDIYGLTKLWSEQLAELFARSTGKAVGVARLFNVFGPGETNPHLIPTIVRQLQQGPELKLGNLSTKRDYIYVEDVARGLIALAEAVRSGESLTCNLGSGRQYEGREIIETVARLMERDVQLTTDVGRVRASDRPSLLSDSTRASEALGWQPQTSWEQGLAKTVERPVAAGVTFV